MFMTKFSFKFHVFQSIQLTYASVVLLSAHPAHTTRKNAHTHTHTHTQTHTSRFSFCGNKSRSYCSVYMRHKNAGNLVSTSNTAVHVGRSSAVTLLPTVHSLFQEVSRTRTAATNISIITRNHPWNWWLTQNQLFHQK